MSSRFRIYANNTYGRLVTINDKTYKITIPKHVWDENSLKISSHVTYWVRSTKNGVMSEFKYGNVEVITNVSSRPNICDVCNRIYKTRSGLLKHIKRKHTDISPVHEDTNTNTIMDNDATETYIHTPSDVVTDTRVNTSNEPYVSNVNIVTHDYKDTTINTGYVYCFETESMPGTYKIGMTTRNTEARLYEANQSNTWKPPIPYHIVYSKYVHNPLHKEKMIHTVLSEYRVVSSREFFKVNMDKIRCIFELLDEHPKT